MPIQVSKQGTANAAVNENTGTFHTAFRPIIIMAQCFALFPVNGILSPNSSDLRFTWKSFKIVYCCLFIMSVFILSLLSTHQLATTSINANKISNLVFFLEAGINALLFLKLARKWPDLVLSWEKMERKVATKSKLIHPYVSCTVKFRIICTVVMMLALAEHILSILSGYARSVQCARNHGNIDVANVYFILKFPELFTKHNYALWKAFIIKVVNIISTFSWTFIDLFLILMSVSLTDQFKYFNRRLYTTFDKIMPEDWWTEARKDFNYLATITRKVDSEISSIVLLSFSANLYFICIQLLNSFNPMPNIIHRIYFCFSFGFLLLRTVAVSLYAANIHEESLLPAAVLYNVETTSFSIEVERFLSQVTTDHISLTGMKFFSVTRSLILTVVGTIVTYELVLMQFNSIQDDQQENSSNMTKVCNLK